MALGVLNPTLLDVMQKENPDGSIATDIAEVIAQTNDVMEFISFKQGNLKTGHKSIIRAGYPAGTWKKIYGAVACAKSKTAQVTDTCGMLRNMCDIDEDLGNISDIGGLRGDEDIAAIMGLTETFVSAFFYSNTAVNPEQVMGLSGRYDTPSTDATLIGYNMIDGGATDNSSGTLSIWLLGFSPMTLFGIFPDGSKGGLSAEDCGKVWVDVFDGSNVKIGENRVYRTYFKWDCGLVLKDWRYCVRICNIDVAALKADPTGATVKLLNLMVSAYERLPQFNLTRNVWCMNRTARTLLHKQALEGSKYMCGFTEVGGKRMVSVMDIPIARCDALLNTESVILDAAGTFAGD